MKLPLYRTEQEAQESAPVTCLFLATAFTVKVFQYLCMDLSDAVGISSSRAIRLLLLFDGALKLICECADSPYVV
jgi:hypothetical protein